MLKKRLVLLALAALMMLPGLARAGQAQPWERMTLPPGDIPWQDLGEQTDTYLLHKGDAAAAVRGQPKAGAKEVYIWRRFALRAIDYAQDEKWHQVALPGGTGYVPSSQTELLPPEQRPRLRAYTETAGLGYVYIASTGQLPLVADLGCEGKHHQLLLPNDGEWQPLLLTLGAGEYTLNVYEAGLYDRPVRLLYQCAFSLAQAIPDTELALYSSLHTNMAENPVTVALAVSLCRNARTNQEKVAALWDWLISHASYDKALSKTIQFSEIPEPDAIVRGEKGICSDYAAFMAVGLRAVGVPCKHVYGLNKRTGHDHAWNEVYLNGAWKLVDVTMAQSRESKKFHTESPSLYGVEAGTWDGFH